MNFETLTATEIQTLTGNRSVVGWIEDGSEFDEWFCNRDHNRQRLEAAAELAIDIFEQTMADPEARSSDKLAAAREIMKYADYTPTQRKEVVYKDKTIGDMSDEELRSYIDSNIKLVK